MIHMIVAHDSNFLIGKDGWMPWNIPQDLALFKQTTLNQSILFGRKTFEGINRVLPNRFTYVLTKNKQYEFKHENVEVINDIQSVIQKFKDSEEILFICGGAEVYKLCLPYVTTIYASVIKENYEGDTYLVDYTKEGFIEDLEVEYPEFYFKVYERE